MIYFVKKVMIIFQNYRQTSQNCKLKNYNFFIFKPLNYLIHFEEFLKVFYLKF